MEKEEIKIREKELKIKNFLIILDILKVQIKIKMI